MNWSGPKGNNGPVGPTGPPDLSNSRGPSGFQKPGVRFRKEMAHMGIPEQVITRWEIEKVKLDADDTEKVVGDGEVLIYGPVVDDITAGWVRYFYGDEVVVSPGDVKKRLREVSGDISLLINSPGGDLYACSAIVNLLALYGRDNVITSRVDGLAASAGSLIMMTGSRIIMAKLATIMIHRAWSWTWGNANEMRKVADFLDGVDREQASIFSKRLGMDEKETMKLLDAETWYSSSEALEAGMADEVVDLQAKEAEASLGDLSSAAHAAFEQRNLRLASLIGR